MQFTSNLKFSSSVLDLGATNQETENLFNCPIYPKDQSRNAILSHTCSPQISDLAAYVPCFDAISDMLRLCDIGSDCCKKSCVRKSCEKPCQGLLLFAVFVGAAFVVRRSRSCPQSSPQLCHRCACAWPCTSMILN